MTKVFNLFSQSPTLRINGEIRPNTIFGTIIGLITVSILTGAFTYVLHNYFSRLHFELNSYIDNSAKPEIDLENLKIGFHIIDGMGIEFSDHERLFTISAKFWEIYLPKFGENTPQKVDFMNIPIIKCNEYKNDSIHQKNFNEYAKNYNVTCLDLPSINKTLKGVYGKLGR